MLDELIARFRAEEITFDEFVETAAANFHFRKTPTYPETDGDEAGLTAVSAVTLANAVLFGDLTSFEANAIRAAAGTG